MEPLRLIVWPGMPDPGGLEEAGRRIGRELDLTWISSNEDLESLLDIEVTTSTKSRQRGASAPAVITVITGDEMRARGYTSLADALRQVPGFYDVYDLVQHNVGVRGINGGPRAGGNVLKLMIDGHSVDYRATTANFFGEELIPLEAVDRVEIIYNGFISAVNQEVRLETLLPLQQADILGGEEGEEPADEPERGEEGQGRALWDYEPDPEEILARLVPDYVEISIFRALLESTASEHGARMSAMRNASDNAAELIDDLTLAANRQRQAEITQEIMEVVAGAEGLR